MAHFYWTKTRLYRESQRTQPQKIWMVGFPVLFFNQHAGTSLHRENEIAHKGLDGPPCRGSSPVRGQGLDLATSAPAGATRRAPYTGWPRHRVRRGRFGLEARPRELAAHRRAQPRAGLLAAIRTARSRQDWARAHAPQGPPGLDVVWGSRDGGKGSHAESGVGSGSANRGEESRPRPGSSPRTEQQRH
jgi:hypothetical protein